MPIETDLIHEARRLVAELEKSYSQKTATKLMQIQTLLLCSVIEQQGWLKRNMWNLVTSATAVAACAIAVFK